MTKLKKLRLYTPWDVETEKKSSAVPLYFMLCMLSSALSCLIPLTVESGVHYSTGLPFAYAAWGRVRCILFSASHHPAAL